MDFRSENRLRSGSWQKIMTLWGPIKPSVSAPVAIFITDIKQHSGWFFNYLDPRMVGYYSPCGHKELDTTEQVEREREGHHVL